MNTRDSILETYRNRGKNYTWDVYQPIPLPGYEETFATAGRCCVDRLQGILARIREVFGDRKLRIADVGCNSGFFCFSLANQGHDVVGIDGSAKYVARCNFLADTAYPLPNRPSFRTQLINETNLASLSEFDLVLCFSVLHHFPNRFQLLSLFSDQVPYAYLELDGPLCGELDVSTFYHRVTKVAEANDPYGRGTRQRIIWEGDRRGATNLKKVNHVRGRSVFLSDGVVTKRAHNIVQHTWLHTNLRHEFEVYQRYPNGPYFPKLLSSRFTDAFCELKLEYIVTGGKPDFKQVQEFYAFLRERNLFIIDFVRDMFLFDTNGRLKVVDLESIFEVPDGNLRRYTKSAKALPYDTYEKQLNFLEHLYRT